MTARLLPLADVCEINPRLPRNHDLKDGTEVSFVPMAAVNAVAGEILDKQSRSFGEVKKGYTHFRDGDVLFAKITPCMENGKAAVARELIGGFGFGSTEFHVLRSKESVLPEWLYYFVRRESFRMEAKRNFTGTAGQQRVPATFLSTAEIPVPSLSEQRRIVDLLSRAEGIVRLRRDAQKKAAELIPAIFLDMFGEPESNAKQLSMRRVADFVARFAGGKNIQAGSEDPEGYRILKVSAVTSGWYREVESKPAPDNYTPPSAHLVREGDMLFSRANTIDLVGATAIVEATDGKTLLPDKLWRFVWAEDLDIRYMHALFQLPAIRRALGKLATGTSDSMRNISQAKLFALQLPIASLEQQRAFSRLSEFARSIQSQQSAPTDKAQATFDSLLATHFQLN